MGREPRRVSFIPRLRCDCISKSLFIKSQVVHSHLSSIRVKMHGHTRCPDNTHFHTYAKETRERGHVEGPVGRICIQRALAKGNRSRIRDSVALRDDSSLRDGHFLSASSLITRRNWPKVRRVAKWRNISFLFSHPHVCWNMSLHPFNVPRMIRHLRAQSYQTAQPHTQQTT